MTWIYFHYVYFLFRLWQEACTAYAKQLSETPGSDPIATASYFLACHNLEEAINVLVKSDHFKEAYALAKCKFADDSLLKEILMKWGKYCLSNGAFETAAQCYIVAKEYEEAAKCLFKRSDSKALALAVECAKRSGNGELIDITTARFNMFKDSEVELQSSEIHHSESGNIVKVHNSSLQDLPSKKESFLKKEQDDVKQCINNLLSDNINKLEADTSKQVVDLEQALSQKLNLNDSSNESGGDFVNLNVNEVENSNVPIEVDELKQ